MRLVVSAGDRAVEIHLRGHRRKTLRHAEKTATRLLAAPADTKPPAPGFGFTVGSDTHLSAQDGGDDG